MKPTNTVSDRQEFNEELKRGREEGNDESAPKAISDGEDKEEKKAE